MANRAFPSLPVVTSSAVGSQPLLLSQGSYFGMCPPSTTSSFQQAMTNQNNTCWSVPPTMCARSQDPTQVGEPLQHFVPQAGWLPVSSNQAPGGNARNFSPAPGTGTGNGTVQPLDRFMGTGQMSGSHNATMYNGSLVNFGFGAASPGVVGSHGSGSSCYSLFSSDSGSHTTPFSAVGGLLNLDTNHVRYEAVSTGSPHSVNSDLSDGQNSLSAEPCVQRNRSSSSPMQQNCPVESIGSSLPGGCGDGRRQSCNEWPNI